VRVRFGGSLRLPPGGLVLESPLARPLREVVVDGAKQPTLDAQRVVLHTVPREVELRGGDDLRTD
jgi:hypothetical protein